MNHGLFILLVMIVAALVERMKFVCVGLTIYWSLVAYF